VNESFMAHESLIQFIYSDFSSVIESKTDFTWWWI